MTIYGLFTLSHHGGQRVLTVMSNWGVKAALEDTIVTDHVTCKARPGYLTQYWASERGAFEQFVETNHIVVLNSPEWVRKKQALGDSIL